MTGWKEYVGRNVRGIGWRRGINSSWILICFVIRICSNSEQESISSKSASHLYKSYRTFSHPILDMAYLSLWYTPLPITAICSHLCMTQTDLWLHGEKLQYSQMPQLNSITTHITGDTKGFEKHFSSKINNHGKPNAPLFATYRTELLHLSCFLPAYITH